MALASLIWALLTLLLPLVSAKGSFTVPVKYNPDFVPDGTTAYARALRRWSPHPRSLTKITAQKGQIGNVPAKTVEQDLEYLSLVGFGTPPQYLPMDLDTGSTDVWVYSTNMFPQDTENRTVYDPTKSTTALLLPNVTWDITYGDESNAGGVVYVDTINIAGIQLENATVESATHVDPLMAEDTSMSGVFGLAYNMPSDTTPKQKTVLSSLAPRLNSSLFTADLKFHGDGEYEFGYINKSKYAGELYYAPLNDGAKYWSLNFTMYKSNNENVWVAQDHEAIVDTGTSLLLLPNSIVWDYYSNVPGSSSDDPGMVIPCDSKLPPLHIAFGHTEDSKFTIPGEYLNYAQLPEQGANSCLGGIQFQDDSPFSILGDVFLKAVFTVFDTGNGRLGFGAKPFNNATRAVYPA